jgi:hypothetical protein
MEVASIRRLTVTERSQVMEGHRTRLALQQSRPESRRLASTRRSVRSRSTICSTALTLARTKLLSCCLSSRRRERFRKEEGKLQKLSATTERLLTTETARPRISCRRISESRSRYFQTQAQTTQLYRAVLWRTQGSVASLSRSRCCRSSSC